MIAHNNQRQSDSQRYAPFVLLAGAQTLTQNVLRAGCACAGRYAARLPMKKIILIVFWLISLDAIACISEPSYVIARDPDRYFTDSEAVFFGKLSNLVLVGEYTQLATFSVEKVYKGDVAEEVTVLNYVTTSCSRPFGEIGYKYYIFSKQSDINNQFLIGGYSTFVPEPVALKLSMELR